MPVTEWGVVYRVLDDDEEHALLRLHILDVPADAEKPQIKKALERAGRTYGEGKYLWGNHSVLPRDRWPLMYSSESDEPAEEISYADLLDEGNGERRVTLRLPVGLHMALVKSASSASASLNQFCLQALAAAVAYDLSPVVAADSSALAAALGMSQQTLTDIFQNTPPEIRQELQEQAKMMSALPPERVKKRQLAAYSHAAAQVAEQAGRMDAFSDDDWEATAAKFGNPGGGPDMKAEYERHRANRPQFLAQMTRTFQEKSEVVRSMTAEQVKAVDAMVSDLLNATDAQQPS